MQAKFIFKETYLQRDGRRGNRQDLCLKTETFVHLNAGRAGKKLSRASLGKAE